MSLVTNYCDMDPPTNPPPTHISTQPKLFFLEDVSVLIGGWGAVRLPALLHGDKASTHPVNTLI